MKNYLFVSFFILIQVLFAQSTESNSSEKLITDGPYIFLSDSSYVINWIENSKLKSKEVLFKNKICSKDSLLGLPLNLILRKNFRVEKDELSINSDIAVISDMHGQFEVFRRLLKNANVIDDNLNWSFGNGYLVIIGDAFDRGEKVNEIFWLIVKLELQAKNKGGGVHYLLGNHDFMVLNNDLRYVNKKYFAVSKLLKKTIPEMYGKRSVLGKWLRSKNVILGLNKLVFNHAGLSKEIAKSALGIQKINKIFREKLIGITKKEVKADSLLTLLYRSKGPIWYRGYFRDREFTENDLDTVLTLFNKNKIFVGHTSFNKINTYFNNKLISIDSKIKTGKMGEILIISKGKYKIINGKGIKRSLF